MAPTPVPAPRIRAPRIIAVLTAVAAAAGYAAMRMSVTGAVHLPFTGLCERLRVDPQPGDWWCHMSQTRMTVAFVGASLLVGLAIALPCAILAATGRRWSALFPLAIPLAVAGAWRGFLTVQSLIWIDRPGPSPSSPFLGIWQTWTMNLGGNGYWIEHPATAAGVDAVLLAVPALAISRAVRANGVRVPVT